MVYRWRNDGRRVAGVISTLMLFACTSGPGREDQLVTDLSRRLCERVVGCGCVDEDVLSLDECSDLAADFGEDEPLPYAFDAECGQQTLDLLNAASCGDTVLLEQAEACPLYFGALLEGAPCGEAIPREPEDFGEFEERCGRGLACVRGACMRTADIPYGSEGFPCEAGGGCDTGLSCIGSCVRLPTAGQPCLEGFCADTARCVASQNFGDDAICEARANLGESCMGHEECISRNCPAGFCEAAASTGAECDSRLPCGPGLSCVDGACEAPNSCGLFFTLLPDL